MIFHGLEDVGRERQTFLLERHDKKAVELTQLSHVVAMIILLPLKVALLAFQWLRGADNKNQLFILKWRIRKPIITAGII
jgi:hypothetical protein